ncbi:hypothetical protein LguiA_011123 [Lonicera macranthoides]
MGKKPSWVCTLATQFSLCLALYVFLNMGQPQRTSFRTGSVKDVYFISVIGGFRPLDQQTLLLKQIEKAVKAYKARFVVNISKLGEDDPLMHNATLYFHSKIPWYTTRALKGPQVDYFVKQIKIPYGKTLDVIALNTGSLQDSPIGNANDHLKWLTRTLEASSSNWRIVVGFHPLVACNENIERIEARQAFELLHHIFLKHGVDVYLSGADQTDKGPYFTTVDKNLVTRKEMVNGFLLHRVGSLEIVTYLVSLKGEVVNRIYIKQRGRGVM